YNWINEHMLEWLGEKNAADTLAQSIPDNVTSEMGLALLDLADAIRPYPEAIAYLEQTADEAFLDALAFYTGGEVVRAAFTEYLEQYGMRCAGEIDITRTRWSERPMILLPMVLANLKNFAAGESQRRFEAGLKEAANKEQQLLRQLELLPDGGQKARATKDKIERLRMFSGYREYPKYSKICRYAIYKKALRNEAKTLLDKGLIQQITDVDYLSLQEFREMVIEQKSQQVLIEERREAYKGYEKLKPPRIITSDGEVLNGAYHHSMPAGAIAGLAVSSGIVEGRARVILNMEDADLGDDDILVTTFTDPSWTPLFIGIKGLVTEVGGLMTHGAVIAREYGLPAVVGVDHA
ncbi:MAG: phosphoenolpyruvate synthase, partial [Sphingobacteriales bacterium]